MATTKPATTIPTPVLLAAPTQRQVGAERAKRLADVADLAAGVRFGWPGFADRLDESGGGFRTSIRADAGA